jgi:hypothetical protein
MSATGRDNLHPSMQQVYDRASVDEQTRYLELMRYDPVAGMAYLEALAVEQQEAEGRL